MLRRTIEWWQTDDGWWRSWFYSKIIKVYPSSSMLSCTSEWSAGAMISSAALLFSSCKTFVGRQQRNTSVCRNLSSLLNTSTSVCFCVCQRPVFMFPRWWFLSFSGSEPHARRLDDCQPLPVWSDGKSLPEAVSCSPHGSLLLPTDWCWRQRAAAQTHEWRERRPRMDPLKRTPQV